MPTTVSVRGQTVIPSVIRKKYKIGPNTKVEFIDTGNEIVLVPIPPNAFAHSKGIFKGVSTNDLIRERRRERKLEHGKR